MWMPDATALLRLYARWRGRVLDRQDAVAEQARQLQHLVWRAMDTRFGRAHGFRRINGVADFQRQVPLRRYEEFWRGWWQPAFPRLDNVTWPGPIPYFAATSGTSTGRTKYIPVSRAMVRANRRAAFDILTHHMRAKPDSTVLGGRTFMLGGSTALERLAPSVFAGDLSGIAAREVPAWARPFYFPPPDLALLSDWDRKVDMMGRRSLAEDVRMIGGTASWLLLFFDRLADLAGRSGSGPPRAVDFYPDIQLVVHGGVGFAPYRAAFERLLAGSRADLREVYPASEGFIAIADRGPGEGLRLIVDNGLFFEFVPADRLDDPDPPRHWLGTARVGAIYALALTSNAGLWSYLLGDLVRLVSLDPPRLLVVGRTSQTLSAFGEHLIGEEIERAITAAADATGLEAIDYTVGAVHERARGAIGHHLFIVEFAGRIPNAERGERFAAMVDQVLCRLNADYQDHRVAGFGIGPPRLLAAPPGTFARWMRARGRLGGQNKVPRVLSDGAALQELRAMAATAPEG